EPPRGSVLSGTLAVGLIRPPAPGNAVELARPAAFSPAPVASPPPLPPQAVAPSVGPPPAPRPPLPLQTELIVSAQPAAAAPARPGAVPARSSTRSDEPPAPQRRG